LDQEKEISIPHTFGMMHCISFVEITHKSRHLVYRITHKACLIGLYIVRCS